MPKLSKTFKSAPPAPPAVISKASQDPLPLAHAIMLAEAAQELGLTPQDVASSQQRLAEAGLPSPLAISVVRRATELFRDHIDAALWRANSWIKDEVEKAFRNGGRVDIGGAARELVAKTPPSVPSESPKPRPKVQTETSPIKGDSDASEGDKSGVPVEGKRSQRTNLFGIPGTGIVRWLGAQGVDFVNARQILDRNGLAALNDSTLKIQLRAGATGDEKRGPVPSLTAEQSKQLIGK